MQGQILAAEVKGKTGTRPACSVKCLAGMKSSFHPCDYLLLREGGEGREMGSRWSGIWRPGQLRNEVAKRLTNEKNCRFAGNCK